MIHLKIDKKRRHIEASAEDVIEGNGEVFANGVKIGEGWVLCRERPLTMDEKRTLARVMSDADARQDSSLRSDGRW
jgi:hypothetical protein